MVNDERRSFGISLLIVLAFILFFLVLISSFYFVDDSNKTEFCVDKSGFVKYPVCNFKLFSLSCSDDFNVTKLIDCDKY